MNMTAKKQQELKEIVEKIVGLLAEWDVLSTSVTFRANRPVTMTDILALSEALGTDAINFNFGDSGEAGYSDETPGRPGEPGYIEVKFPIVGFVDAEGRPA